MSETAAPTPRFWRSVAQALRGEHHDYTSEPLDRAVLLLAVPMVLEMVMESLFAVADVFWVSRLGHHAIAIVGITESVMTLIYTVAIGIAMAATAIVARRIGEKNPEGAARTGGQVLLLGAIVAVVLGVVLGVYAPHILRLMGAGEDLIAAGTPFARIMLGGNATVLFIFLINAIFRGAGDAVIAMRTLWLANGINIFLCPCFIFGWGPFPELGLTGAAIATNLGRALGVVYQLWHLRGPRAQVRVRLAHLFPRREELIALLRLSSSGVAQFLINTASWIGMIKIIAYFGSTALAGYTIAIRLIIFVLMPAWGLSNAAATLVGQNLGAQKPERAEAAVWIATRYNTVFLTVIGLGFVVFARPLVGLFTQEPEVLAVGARALWIIGLGFPLYGVGMCLTAAFNGAGDTWTPTKLNFFCFWLGEIPLALLLGLYGFGLTGVFIATPIAFIALAAASAFVFRRGKWKTQKV